MESSCPRIDESPSYTRMAYEPPAGQWIMGMSCLNAQGAPISPNAPHPDGNGRSGAEATGDARCGTSQVGSCASVFRSLAEVAANVTPVEACNPIVCNPNFSANAIPGLSSAR
ncbi:Hypothetical protein I5071_52770 [Sandaracinus amylolyticus]|nr:Hypothetical protein I5071_52770 [Sandaracinus amylolyticus]